MIIKRLNEDNKKRILIIGYGSMGQKHHSVIKKLLPHAEVKILRRVNSAIDKNIFKNCIYSYEEAVSFRPQITVIANPASMHIKSAIEMALIGSHILIEKPISNNSTGVKELVDLCKSKNQIIVCGYNLRFLPSLKKFRELIQSHEIGKVISFRCEVGQYLPNWRPNIDYRNSVSASSDLGGGVLLELSHEVDYLSWIFGEIAWIKGWLYKQSNLEINVEDTAHLVISFDKFNLNHTLVGVANLDFVRQDKTRSCIAIGDSGSLRWDGISGTIDKYSSLENDWVSIVKYKESIEETYTELWRNFINALDGLENQMVDGLEALQILKKLEDVRDSNLHFKSLGT